MLSDVGFSLIPLKLGLPTNQFLNMYITVWSEAGNGFSACILSPVYPSLVSALPPFLPSFLPSGFLSSITLKRNGSRRKQISSRSLFFLNHNQQQYQSSLPQLPTMLFKYSSLDMFFPKFPFLLIVMSVEKTLQAMPPTHDHINIYEFLIPFYTSYTVVFFFSC